MISMQQFTLPLKEIQQVFKSNSKTSGWLIYEYKGCNKAVQELLGFCESHGEIHFTRRFFYWIPASGNPLKIVHFIDSELVDHLPGEKMVYTSWKDLQQLLESILKGSKEIAMEYSPQGMIPTLSSLDAGTGEWIRSLGISIVSSWPFLEPFVSKLGEHEKELHRIASLAIKRSMDSACALVRDAISRGKKIFEYDIQQHILQNLDQEGFITDYAPIVATGVHSSLPHYTPTASKSGLITSGLLLLDVWCKKKEKGSPYADHTMVAWVGSEVPEKVRKIYSTVYAAQKKAIEFIKKEWAVQKEILGFQVDDVCRSYIKESDYGNFFSHRTGHNICEKLHGDGVNFDNFETHDTRRLTANTCYSIEPGIYLPEEFGVRLECNVVLHTNGSSEFTGIPQVEIPTILT